MKAPSMSTILMLVASSLIFFFVGRYSVSGSTASSNSISTSSTSTNSDPIANNDELSSKGGDIKTDNPIAVNDVKPVEEESNPEETETTNTVVEEEPVMVPEVTTPVEPIAKPRDVVASAELPRMKMGISDNKIGSVLTSVAENLEAKRLAYVSSQMQDCSGIFHQLKDSLQSRLPALAQDKGAFQYPSPTVARSSRQIADWYYKKNNLLIVEDAMASRNSIRPGSVMFYGKSGKKFSNIDIDMLTDRDNNFTSNGAIQHIAVVTTVNTDENGNVIDYTIMHGRNKRVHASRSGSKAVQSLRTKGLPPFGNWKQQLVAIANITTAKK